MSHKTEDFKLAAVRFYLEKSHSMDQVCNIFKCSKSSLKRWIDRYKKEKSIKRHNRKPLSYKVTKKHVDLALKLLNKNQQISMVDLSTLLKQKNQSFNATPQHLGAVLRDNNKTRKRTRHRHFPLVRYKKPISLSKELNTFYTKINQYPLDKKSKV